MHTTNSLVRAVLGIRGMWREEHVTWHVTLFNHNYINKLYHKIYKPIHNQISQATNKP